MATLPESIASVGRQLQPGPAFVARRLRQLLAHWATLRRERLELAELDARMLRDIGVDRVDALREAERPFWEGRERLRRDWR